MRSILLHQLLHLAARRRCGALLAAAVLLPLVLACASAPGPERPGIHPAPPPDREAAATGVEATSLLGTPLLRPEPPATFRAKQESLLAAARERLAAAPEELDSWIWVGRRFGYLSRYGEAIAVFTEALERFPDAAELYRHRGHRYLSVRELALARADLERAAELMAARPDAVEPDGLPNAFDVPTSTLRSNVFYHLGLACYLEGDGAGAVAAWEEARRAVDNPDNLVAASYWLFIAHALSGDAAAAEAVLHAISAELAVIENREYHRLLLVFRGEVDGALLLAQAEAGGEVQLGTIGYGIAVWHLLRGEREAAGRLLGRVVAETPWPAFGHLAAEALLARDAELRRIAGR